MRTVVRLLVASALVVLLAALVIAVLITPRTETSTDADNGRVMDLETALERSERSVTRRSTSRPAAAETAIAGSNAASVARLEALAPPPQRPLGPRERISAATPIYMSSRPSSGPLMESDLGTGDVQTGVMVFNEDGSWLEVRLDAMRYGFVRGEDIGAADTQD